jgi:hypothetical protein
MNPHETIGRMLSTREKFATQVDRDLLSDIRKLAEQEGRHLQSLVEEALADLIEKRKAAGPRPSVMAEYRASIDQYGALYQKLAR